MKEGWGVDGYYTPPHNLCYPFCVNDDGTALSEQETRDRYQSTWNFMYNNDSINFGEKPVSHIKVNSNLVLSPEDAVMCNGRPMNCVYTEYGSYGWYWTRYVETFMNGYHERGYKHFGSTPRITDCWYDVTYTQVLNTNRHYLTYFNGHGTCSESYGREYGCDPSGFVAGTSQRYVEYSRVSDKPYFRKVHVDSHIAMKYFNLLAPKHTPPPGIYSELWRTAMNSVNFNTNSIANVVDMVNFVKDVKHGRIFDSIKDLKDSSIVKAASNAWMGYRYSYSTTKSDIEEYTSKAAALSHYDETKQHIVRSGISTDAGVYHCKVVYQDKRQNDMCELYKKLKRTGLALDAYNAWDMVPLSFVADWFLPIGDYLEDLSSNWVSNPGYFTIRTITMSEKWKDQLVYSNGQVTVTSYTRTVSTEPPPFESYSEDPSTGTVVKRLIDGVCLLIG